MQSKLLQVGALVCVLNAVGSACFLAREVIFVRSQSADPEGLDQSSARPYAAISMLDHHHAATRWSFPAFSLPPSWMRSLPPGRCIGNQTAL